MCKVVTPVFIDASNFTKYSLGIASHTSFSLLNRPSFDVIYVDCWNKFHLRIAPRIFYEIHTKTLGRPRQQFNTFCLKTDGGFILLRTIIHCSILITAAFSLNLPPLFFFTHPIPLLNFLTIMETVLSRKWKWLATSICFTPLCTIFTIANFVASFKWFLTVQIHTAGTDFERPRIRYLFKLKLQVFFSIFY